MKFIKYSNFGYLLREQEINQCFFFKNYNLIVTIGTGDLNFKCSGRKHQDMTVGLQSF